MLENTVDAVLLLKVPFPLTEIGKATNNETSNFGQEKKRTSG
jgi:hypothetical protein